MAKTQAKTRIGAVALNASNHIAEAAFWRDLLGLEIIRETPDFNSLSGAAVLINVHRVVNHVAPDWPDGGIPKQLHLDLSVDDLDRAERSALELGASKALVQPKPELWRVLVDPAGHPFCLTNILPPPY